jgi:hypothetical protein
VDIAPIAIIFGSVFFYPVNIVGENAFFIDGEMQLGERSSSMQLNAESQRREQLEQPNDLLAAVNPSKTYTLRNAGWMLAYSSRLRSDAPTQKKFISLLSHMR